MGRPGTKVFPDDWAATHAGVIANAVSNASKVTIGPAGGTSSWNEGLGRTVTMPKTPVYAGPAELMPVSDTARALLVVEDPVKARVYDVTLPTVATKAIEVDMVLTVDPADADAFLAGRTLRVGHIERGSRRFSRPLLAVLLD